MTFGSLFTGIGGIDLGLERAGMTCKWQVEIDSYARKILRKHWPDVRRRKDVKRFPPANGDWQVDLIAGGFPCQPVSLAGKGKAQKDERWLWPEFARIVRILEPRYVLVENVPGLYVRGFGDVLGDLAKLGYDAEWDRIPAAAVGAPHLRWRAFVVAYSRSAEPRRLPNGRRKEISKVGKGVQGPASDAQGVRSNRAGHDDQEQEKDRKGRRGQGSVGRPNRVAPANTDESGRGTNKRDLHGRKRNAVGRNEKALPNAASIFSGQLWRQQFKAFCQEARNLYWPQTQPGFRGMDDGLPRGFHEAGIPPPTTKKGENRKERLKCLGNAVVPQIIQYIGERIMKHEGA